MTLDEIYHAGENAPITSREYNALDRVRRTLTGLQYSIGLPPKNDHVISNRTRCQSILEFLGADRSTDLFDKDGMVYPDKLVDLLDYGRTEKNYYGVTNMDDALAKKARAEIESMASITRYMRGEEGQTKPPDRVDRVEREDVDYDFER